MVHTAGLLEARQQRAPLQGAQLIFYKNCLRTTTFLTYGIPIFGPFKVTNNKSQKTLVVSISCCSMSYGYSHDTPSKKKKRSSQDYFITVEAIF